MRFFVLFRIPGSIIRAEQVGLLIFRNAFALIVDAKEHTHACRFLWHLDHSYCDLNFALAVRILNGVLNKVDKYLLGAHFIDRYSEVSSRLLQF